MTWSDVKAVDFQVHIPKYKLNWTNNTDEPLKEERILQCFVLLVVFS